MVIREAQPTDAAGIARVHVDSWRSTYVGIVPDAVLAGLSYERSEQSWLRGLTNPNSQSFHFVAENLAGETVGFAVGGPEREGRGDYQGEVYALYLLRDHQRLGLGRALMANSAERLHRRGLTNMLIWVLADNPNRRFYEALGGAPVAEKPIDIGGATLAEVAYGWLDLQPLAALARNASSAPSVSAA